MAQSARTDAAPEAGPGKDEQLFRLLVQSVKDHAIYMLDRSGLVASWNPGAQRFKGYLAREIVGQHFSCFYSPEDRATGMPALALATAERDGRFEAEGWRVRKDGSRFWARVVIEPVLSDDGELIGFAKVTRDLTDQLLARQALEDARLTLSHSQKMETVGQLTGGVAHDFNNLLAAIMGNLDLARSRLEGGAETRRLLDAAMAAAERGAALTHRMLAFARKQDLEISEVDVSALIEGMSDLLARTLGDAIAVRVDVPPDLPPVRADAAQLELALLNLAVNAREAMPEGGSVAISAGRAAPTEAGFVRLVLADRGIGMDAQTLSRATEPFFTTKEVGKGPGLGLSMVQGFVEQCGGQLRLASVAGEGTTAELWLRLADRTATPEHRPAASRPAPREGLRVLVVDDDPLVLASTTDMLEMLGHEAVSASSGAKALGLLEATPFDLLVTDFTMPGMTGGQLARLVRADHPALPILLVSGFAELPPGAPAMEKLRKPFNMRRLGDAIGRALAGAPA